MKLAQPGGRGGHQKYDLSCNNPGGRGRYRTADRWCVKPELYH
jgi:hypothetical protein